MGRLSDAQLKREITRLARALYGFSTLEEIGNFLAAEIGRLIGHDSAVFCEGEKASGLSTYYTQTMGEDFHRYEDVIARYMYQTPFIPHYIARPGGPATRTFDLVAPAVWHRTEIFNEAFIFLGIEEQLGGEIPCGAGTVRGFMLNRAKPGFSRRDTEIFDLLRPHIASASTIADQWQRWDQAASGSRRRASIMLDARGRVTLRSPGAASLLISHTGPFSGVLPQQVEDWARRELRHYSHPELWAAPREALRLEGEDSALMLRLASAPEGDCHIILIEERAPTPPYPEVTHRLSPREREVLDWIASGKSNDEVARILGVSVHTVKNHVKHILAALGVDNRTSAAAMHLREQER